MAGGTPIFSGMIRPRQGSRPIDVSGIGDRFMQRQQSDAAAKAAAKKQQDANMKEVMKNLSVEPQFTNSVFNRQAFGLAAEAVNDVVSMYATGDSSAYVQSLNRVRKWQADMKELEEIDKNWVEASKVLNKAVENGQGSWLVEEFTIPSTGKTYNNAFSFYNDKVNDGNAKAHEEFNQVAPNLKPFVVERETKSIGGIGNYPVIQGVEASIIRDPTASVLKAATGEGSAQMYTRDTKKFRELKVGNKTERAAILGLGDESMGIIAANALSDVGAINWAIKNYLPEFSKQNPNLSPAEAKSQLLEKVVSDPNFRAEVMRVGGLEPIKNIMTPLERQGLSAEYTPPSKSDSNDPMARAKKTFGQGARSEDGKYIEFSVRGQDQRPVNVTTYTGTQIRPIGGGAWKPVPKGQIRPDQELQKVMWGNSLADSHILYTSKIDASGAKGELDEVYEVKMPLSGQSHGQLAANIGVDADVLAEFFLSNSSETPPEFVRNFLQSMGKSSEGIPGAGPKGASATKAGTSSNPKSKWESAKR